MDLWISQDYPQIKSRITEDDHKLYFTVRLCVVMNLITFVVSAMYHKQIVSLMKLKSRFEYHPTDLQQYMQENKDHFPGFEKEKNEFDHEGKFHESALQVDDTNRWWPVFYNKGKFHHHPLEEPEEDEETQWIRKLPARLRKGYKIGLLAVAFDDKVIEYDSDGEPIPDKSDEDDDTQEEGSEDSQEGSEEGLTKNGKKMKRPDKSKEASKKGKEEENAWLAGQKNKGRRKFFCFGPRVGGSGGSPTSGNGGGKKG